MALIDSKQLNPKFTGSFTLSGSSQTLVGAKVEFTNANVDGNIIAGGTITAQEFHTEFVSASIVYTSGSTKFGDTSDDIHQNVDSQNL